MIIPRLSRKISLTSFQLKRFTSKIYLLVVNLQEEDPKEIQDIIYLILKLVYARLK